MSLSPVKSFIGAALMAGVVCVVPVQAGAITLINDTFSNTTLGEAITGSLGSDPYFSSVYNPLSGCPESPTASCASNIDVVGDIGTVPTIPNMVPFADICAANASTVPANCIDLDGTTPNNNGNAQGAVDAAVTVTTPGTVVLDTTLLGTQGYEPLDRSPISTSVLIVFGNSTCISSTTLAAFETNCLYYDNLALSNPTGVYDPTSPTITVGDGTYYVGVFSETSGQQGALLTDVGLVETPDAISSPEPSSLLLLGSLLLGLGTANALRSRRRSALRRS